jgi:hypothetical protein
MTVNFYILPHGPDLQYCPDYCPIIPHHEEKKKARGAKKIASVQQRRRPRRGVVPGRLRRRFQLIGRIRGIMAIFPSSGRNGRVAAAFNVLFVCIARSMARHYPPPSCNCDHLDIVRDIHVLINLPEPRFCARFCIKSASKWIYCR